MNAAIAVHPTTSINEIVRAAVAEWRSQSPEFPILGPPLAPREQKQREHRADSCLHAVESALRRGRHTLDIGATLAQITSQVVSFLPDALDLPPDAGADSQALLREGLAEIALDLARQARRLDPAISAVDILQAARNAWVACGLQVMLGKPMRLTPSIFAYSMLYPYSDNMLDDPCLGRAGKLEFSRRFERRLQGESPAAHSPLEAIVWHLVGMIEQEYPRDYFPDVWESVLAIHHAQTRSISQLHREGSAFAGAARHDATLDLSVTKGGASVLADAYLAAGHLSPFEAKVAFDWGVVLQLGDDLQDFESDRRRGSLTLFTGAASYGPLDGVANKTFRYGQAVMREVAELPTCPAIMKRLLARSSRLFLIRSVAGAAGHFSRAYVDRLETYSPYRFHFLQQRERRCYRRRRDYGRLFEMAVGCGS